LAWITWFKELYSEIIQYLPLTWIYMDHECKRPVLHFLLLCRLYQIRQLFFSHQNTQHSRWHLFLYSTMKLFTLRWGEELFIPAIFFFFYTLGSQFLCLLIWYLEIALTWWFVFMRVWDLGVLRKYFITWLIIGLVKRKLILLI
jgi:hypothetical protein